MIRVLLVEDDESNRMTMAALLEDDGLVVEEAASFAEARRRIEAPGAAYDAFLMDSNLGDGYGPDLVPAIRRIFPAARIVSLSGNASEDASWADAHAPKGTDPDHVRELLVAPPREER